MRSAGETAERVRAHLADAGGLGDPDGRSGAEQIGERGMSETVYALYACFKATRGFRDLDADDAAQEVENLIKEWEAGLPFGACTRRSGSARTPT